MRKRFGRFLRYCGNFGMRSSRAWDSSCQHCRWGCHTILWRRLRKGRRRFVWETLFSVPAEGPCESNDNVLRGRVAEKEESQSWLRRTGGNSAGVGGARRERLCSAVADKFGSRGQMTLFAPLRLREV